MDGRVFMSGGRSGPWRALVVKVRRLAQPARRVGLGPRVSSASLVARGWLPEFTRRFWSLLSRPGRLSDDKAHMV